MLPPAAGPRVVAPLVDAPVADRTTGVHARLSVIAARGSISTSNNNRRAEFARDAGENLFAYRLDLACLFVECSPEPEIVHDNVGLHVNLREVLRKPLTADSSGAPLTTVRREHCMDLAH